MADQQLATYIHYGTDAERLAFVPDPPAAPFQPIYAWFATDTTALWVYTTTWNQITGSGGVAAPATATYITQTANAGLSAEQAIGALASGILRGANTTGVITSLTTSAGLAANITDYNGILRASGTIANAAIITLPTTKIDLVAAPGAGFYIQPLWLVLKTDFAAGAYGTVNTTFSQIWAQVGTVLGGTLMTVALTNDSTVTPALSQLTVFLGGDSRVSILPSALVSATGGYVVPLYVDNGGVLVSDTENQPLSLYAFNDSGAVNYTGGNAANELKWVAYYTIEAVP